MSVLVVDPRTGAAGDMFAAALIDLGVDISEAVRVLRRVGEVTVSRSSEGTRVHTRSLKHELTHEEALDLVRELSSELGLRGKYARIAGRIVEILVEAERDVHRRYRVGHPDRLHEASDILIDALLVAYCLQQLDPSEIYCLTPVYVGGGVVRFSHGVFEVPAPATRYIIEEYCIPCARGPVDEELLTPTGAAIIAALEPIYMDRRDMRKNFEIEAVGKGLGSKRLPIENALYIYRVRKREGIFVERVVELETNLDDVTPEILGHLFSSLDKALDVQVIPVVGKKNRPAFLLRVWCEEEHERELVERIFRETGTLGIRRRVVERYVRPRWVVQRVVTVKGRRFLLRFKEGKPEFEDLKMIASALGVSVLELQRMLMRGELKLGEA